MRDKKRTLPSEASQFAERLRELLGESPDIIYREREIGELPAIVAYIEGMADPRHLLASLPEERAGREEERKRTPDECATVLKGRLISEGYVREASTLEEVVSELLSGNSVLYIGGAGAALCVGTRKLKQRQVQEATSQSVVRGPRESFTESLRENTALVRRRIQHPALRIEQLKMGEMTRTDVAVMYIEGVVKENVLRELNARLANIRIESVLESNYIEELIQDRRYSPFPTVYNSERPDVVSSALLEGRIAILVEGTPFVLIVPALFVQFFQTSEDYYQRGDFASFVRLLRYFCFALAMLTPSFYIAITTFHQEMIPTTLLLSLIGQREGVPFPSFVEALMMEVTFEILREAGVRLPKSIGQSVSIVGTLVIGQAAVEAGLVSAAMVIVVSITAISNFALPAFNIGISVRLLRFALMAISATFGFYGMIIAMIMLGLHLCSLESMGVPYMTSFAPFRWSSRRDAMLRMFRSNDRAGRA